MRATLAVASAGSATAEHGSGARARANAPLRPTVLVVGPLPPPWHGGAVATRYVLESALAERYRLIHVDTSDRRGMENIGRFEPVNVLLALRHGASFARALARERPALAYVPLAQNRLGFLRDCLFLAPALAAGLPVVVHVHGGGFRAFHDGTDPLTRALVAATMKRVRRAIVLGVGLAPMLSGIVPDERIDVVPNGVADPFSGTVPPRPVRQSVHLLYLGTLMEAKGFLDVLEAARLLRERGDDVRVTLAGAFYRPADRRKAEALMSGPLSDRVTLAGVMSGEDKLALLRDADILVFPTRYAYEGHPYVILEAMAAGLPVVTTAHAAIAETIWDGVTGVLVPPGDVPALAAAVGALARDAEARARMGRAARARYLERYTITTWAERVAETWAASLASP